jgi:hypothetical protein
VKVNEPTAVGIPESTPVSESVTPSSNSPVAVTTGSGFPGVMHPENRTRDCFGRRCGAGDYKDCGAERNNLTHNPSHGPPPSDYCRIRTPSNESSG